MIKSLYSEPCNVGEYRNSTMDYCVSCGNNNISADEGATFCTACGAGQEANTAHTECGKRNSTI